MCIRDSAQGERIPLTIADFDRERDTITLVIQAVGKTTLEMQRDLQLGTHPVSYTHLTLPTSDLV